MVVVNCRLSCLRSLARWDQERHPPLGVEEDDLERQCLLAGGGGLALPRRWNRLLYCRCFVEVELGRSGPTETLMRTQARVVQESELDARLENLRLQVDRLQAHAHVVYFLGEHS